MNDQSPEKKLRRTSSTTSNGGMPEGYIAPNHPSRCTWVRDKSLCDPSPHPIHVQMLVFFLILSFLALFHTPLLLPCIIHIYIYCTCVLPFVQLPDFLILPASWLSSLFHLSLPHYSVCVCVCVFVCVRAFVQLCVCVWVYVSIHVSTHYREATAHRSILPNALAAIGHTPLIRLDKIARSYGLECELCKSTNQPLTLHTCTCTCSQTCKRGQKFSSTVILSCTCI